MCRQSPDELDAKELAHWMRRSEAAAARNLSPEEYAQRIGPLIQNAALPPPLRRPERPAKIEEAPPYRPTRSARLQRALTASALIAVTTLVVLAIGAAVIGS